MREVHGSTHNAESRGASFQLIIWCMYVGRSADARFSSPCSGSHFSCGKTLGEWRRHRFAGLFRSFLKTGSWSRREVSMSLRQDTCNSISTQRRVGREMMGGGSERSCPPIPAAEHTYAPPTPPPKNRTCRSPGSYACMGTSYPLRHVVLGVHMALRFLF